jgi:hypothetical protein
MNKVRMTLVGNGNPFYLLGSFRRKAHEQGWPQRAIDDVLMEAMSGDYGHLVTTLYANTIDEETYARLAAG